MATLISVATGNWTASGSWALVNSTALLDSENNNTALTTSYVASANFTPGAITVDGIAVKLASRTVSPSGTVSIELWNSTDSVSVDSVTIDVADLPSCSTTNNEGGWVFFKFGTNRTLTAGKNYQVRAKTSNSTQVNLYRDSTDGNWSRLLRTTTTQAPAAGDTMHVIGEHTGAGTGNDITITMNETATTDYGGGSTTLASLSVGKRGTLTWGTSASTNYNLRMSGLVIVYNGGTWNRGTSGTPMPASSTAKLEFDCASDGDFGFLRRNGSIINEYGNALTYVMALLSADASASATSLTSDVSTGWKNGDEICIASTTRTNTQCEKRTLSSDASGTTITISSGLTNAHAGTAPIQAEIINITRNVKTTVVTTTAVAYVYTAPTAIVQEQYVEFYYLGQNATNQRGVEIGTTTGSSNWVGCSYHDFEDYGVYVTGSSANNITMTDCVAYNLCSVTGGTTAGAFGVYSGTSGSNISFERCVSMLVVAASTHGFYTADAGISWVDCRSIGAINYGFSVNETNAIISGTIDGIISHSNGGFGFVLSAPVYNSVLGDIIIWRNNNSGLYFSSNVRCLTISSIVAFGNAGQNVHFVGSHVAGVTINALTLNGDSTFSTTMGIEINSAIAVVDLVINDGDFGTAAGIKTAHTRDIDLAGNCYVTIFLNNTKLASATELLGQSNMADGSYIRAQRHDQTAGLHRAWYPYGTVDVDTTTYKTASPSEKITPNNASNKIVSGIKKVAVNSGATFTINAWVRKDASYNGNQPRLVCRKNNAAGVSSDTLIDTMSVGTGTWEQLTGTSPSVTDDAVLEFFVDLDGTAGYVNVDDWSVS